MQGKTYFWAGLGLCVFGIALIVYKTDHLVVHLTGALTVAVGAFVAARNARA